MTATAKDIAIAAGSLVGGERARQHGDKRQNHQNIAALWNAYLGGRFLAPSTALTARDAALMMALLKIARTKAGAHNLDDYVDLAGYAAVAGEIAEGEAEADARAIDLVGKTGPISEPGHRRGIPYE